MDELTPIRAHYLKKSLIQLEFRQELELIASTDPPFNALHPNPALVGTSTSSVSTLSYLGPPFAPPPRHAPNLDLPFLRYIFQQFVIPFPFLVAAPKDFYSAKLQPFVASLLARRITVEDGLLDLLNDEQTKGKPKEDEHRQRHKIITKLERNLALFLGAAIKLVEQEQVVRLSQADLDRLENIAKRRERNRKVTFEVNVVCVRTVVDKGRMRSRVHEEFVVRTRRTGHPDIYVSRRYGDFRTLAKELANAHPDENIRQPPAKDKTVVNVPPSVALSPPTPSYSRISQTSNNSSINGTPPASPLSDENSNTRDNDSIRPPSLLAREKNRLTLRAYLHALMSSSTIASSPVLRSFLLSGPTSLSQEEREDARRREEADRMREDGRKKFAKEIADRVDSLRDTMRSVKGDIMGKDGLTHVFAIVKVTPDLRNLPPNYQSVIEWARISLASTIFHQYVASDDSSESFAGLKRIHGLMPYFMLKTTLKISNPISMIRSILDLFLAQPFGGKSLLQRMFTGSLTEETKALQEQIEAVKDKVDDPIMCAKVRQFVYASRDIQQLFKLDAASEDMHVLTAVLRSAEEPVLSRPQMNRLARAHRAHKAYLRHRASLQDSDDDDGPQDEDAWLLEDLKVLSHLYSRLRDREQLIELIFEGFTADLLKDIITIFYAPLAQVYKAARIADSLSDMQNFINDLIKTVEQVEELGQQDPHRTVQAFIDLVQRHEQSFYHFVHKVHSKGESLFDSLMRWIELFLTVIREGLGEPISLEFLLPHAGKERQDILAEVDKVALYHYKLKVLHEGKLRRRFGRAEGQNDADAEDEATQALVNDVVGEISFSDLVRADADDVAAEDSNSEGDSSEYETDTGSENSGDEDSEDGDSSSDASGQVRERQEAQVGAHMTRVARSRTVSVTKLSSQPPSSQERTPSLKTVWSMNVSTSGRHDYEGTLPEPPPPTHAASVGPLSSAPSNFPRSRHSSRASTQTKPEPSQSRDKSHKAKQKAKKEPLLSPELTHIPKVLPVFVEMVGSRHGVDFLLLKFLPFRCATTCDYVEAPPFDHINIDLFYNLEMFL
ncbi:hypothetical protein AX17_001292 [Amanita inopinata Kibby_2008]|nr:hypothetical protein AX17_001292 [Amanita inopinata Kibby_2008]